MIEQLCAANLAHAGRRVNIHYTLMYSEKTFTRRPYQKRRRAEQEAETRRQITEAAVKLHGTIGPARTTIKSIAAEAGVQRATVYRHFPDLESLFLACSALWASTNPPPSPTEWASVADPDARLRLALGQLYDWYAWAEPMLTNVSRDAPMVPASARASENFQHHFEALHATLMQGRRLRGRARARVAAAIGHALAFSTWRSLAREQRLRGDEAVELMCALVSAAA
jgi:AcrR family transcriptional regulator